MALLHVVPGKAPGGGEWIHARLKIRLRQVNGWTLMKMIGVATIPEVTVIFIKGTVLVFLVPFT